MVKSSVNTFAGILILFAVSAVGRVEAQSLPVAGNPTTFAIGAYFPGSGDVKKYGGTTQLYAELRYGFPVGIPATPTRTVVSVASEFGGANGGFSTIVPITIGEYFGGAGRSPFAPRNYYVGVGIGDYIEHATGIDTAGRIGGYGTVGYNIGEGFFVDAKYQVVEHGNGALVGAGFRF